MCKAEPAHVLLVEDNTLDVLMVQEALAEHEISTDLHIAEDGEAAVQFIDAVDRNDGHPCPALILLDLNLPKRSGTEVLAHVRKSKRCAGTKVLIVTSSDSPGDRAETRRLGASEYFLKPASYEGFLKVGEIVRRMLNDSAPAM